MVLKSGLEIQGSVFEPRLHVARICAGSRALPCTKAEPPKAPDSSYLHRYSRRWVPLICLRSGAVGGGGLSALPVSCWVGCCHTVFHTLKHRIPKVTHGKGENRCLGFCFARFCFIQKGMRLIQDVELRGRVVWERIFEGPCGPHLSAWRRANPEEAMSPRVWEAQLPSHGVPG